MDLTKLTKYCRWRTIAFRLHLFIVLTIVLTVIAVSYFDSRVSIQMMDSQIEQNAISAATQWAQDLARRDAPTDPATIQSWLLRSKESEPYITRIDVYHLSGSTPIRFVTTSNQESLSIALDEATAISNNRPLSILWPQEKGRFRKIIIPYIDFSGIRSCVTVIASLAQSNAIRKIHSRIAYYLDPAQ
jgi:hypothetical protein